jgi:hypothetical protein
MSSPRNSPAKIRAQEDPQLVYKVENRGDIECK